MARDRALAPLPARRPAGRGALPADAAARAPRRGARLRRARRVRRALPAPLGAPGALRGRSTGPRRATTACGRSRSRRRAATIVDTQRARARHEHARARASSSGRPTCPRAGRPQRSELRRSSRWSHRCPVAQILAADAAVRRRPADAGRRSRRGDPPGPDRLPRGAPVRVPGRPARRHLRCATTPTGRSPPRCSATSARSRQAELQARREGGLPAAGRDGAGGRRGELRPLPAGHGRLRTR